MSEVATGIERIEIIQTVSRKRWTAAQKLRIVEESMAPGASTSQIARQHGVSPALLYKWRKLMHEGGVMAISTDDKVVSAAEVNALKKRIAQLERCLGRKTEENEVLKAAVELGRKKKLISLAPLSGIEGFE